MVLFSNQPLRSYIRYAPLTWGREALIKMNGRTIPVQVLDESLGGLGIQVPEPLMELRGTIVHVSNGMYSRKARMVFARAGEGATRIGIEWTPDSSYEPNCVAA